MSGYKLTYPKIDGGEASLPLARGQMAFVVGANGTGKSTLMQRFGSHNINVSRRITAHRQVWFTSDSVTLTPTSREQVERQIQSQDQQARARYRDDNAEQRSQVTIFDLVDFENIQARQIATAAREGDLAEVQRLAGAPGPVELMNSILRVANLEVSVIVEGGAKIMARRDGSAAYSIAELSDGERNAVIIIANVLTAPPGTLILLDEPERHLHRSITSPLLTSLLSHRDDCAFIISTHDVSLPLDQANASALLLRRYRHEPSAWDADHVETIGEIDERVVGAVLGSRRKILFVEGTASSLDRQIYQILYPQVSVVPAGSCVELTRAVKGIRAAEQHHWLLAFGLVDRDNRSDADVAALLEQSVVALNKYSVESLYYSDVIRSRIAAAMEKATGQNAEAALLEASEKAIAAVGAHADRLAARIAERRVRDALLSQAPNWRELKDRPALELSLPVQVMLEEENESIQRMLSDGDLSSLIDRYPVRETPALDHIAVALGFQSRGKYEVAVRKLLTDDEEARLEIRALLQPLTELLDPVRHGEPDAAVEASVPASSEAE